MLSKINHGKILDFCVCYVSDNASGIWGLYEHVNCNTKCYTAIQWVLGVQKVTIVLSISDDKFRTPHVSVLKFCLGDSHIV